MMGKKQAVKFYSYSKEKIILFRIATLKSENTHRHWSQDYIGRSSEKASDGQTRLNL